MANDNNMAGSIMPTRWKSMMSFLDNYKNREEAIKTNIANTEQTQRINNSLSFNQQSYNPQLDVELRNMQHNASRASKLASMIVQFWEDNWISVTWSDADIINQYIWNLSPDLRDAVAERFAQYTHSTEYADDSKEFALEMWWRDETFWDKVWNWIKWFASYLTYWFDKLWRATKKISDATTSKSESELASKDVMNLAEERYWTLALSIPWFLSEEDWNDLQYEIDNDWKQLEKQHNPANIALDLWIGAVMTAVKTNPLWALIDSSIWLASQLPITWDFLNRANERAWDLWAFVNKLPWLSNYRDALITEEAKREFDEFVGNLIIWALFGTAYKYAKTRKSWWGKWGGWNGWWDKIIPVWDDPTIRSEFKEFLDKTSPEEIVDAFEKEKNMRKQLVDKDYGPFEKNEQWIYDRDSVERWLKLLEKDNLETFESTKSAVEARIKDLVNSEDKLLSQDKNTYWKREIKEATKDLNNPNWFDFLDTIFKNVENAFEEMQWELWSDLRSWFKEMKEKYNKWKITRKEINDVLRKTQEVIDMYNEKSKPMDWKLETQTRSAWKKGKEFVWNWLDEYLPWNENVFKNLDGSISDLYTLKRYAQKKAMEVNNSKWSEYYKWEARADLKSKTKWAWATIRKRLKWGIKETWLNIIDKRARIKDYNIQWVEDLLNETYKDFDALSKEIWDADTMKKIENDIKKLQETAIKIKEEEMKNIEAWIDKKLEITEDISKIYEEELSKWENGATKWKMEDIKADQETNNTQLESLRRKYADLFTELLEDMWATKTDIYKVKTEAIQKSLFDI